MLRVFVLSFVFSASLMAAPDFVLSCDDGSGHWHKFEIEVNHPTTKIYFSGDGDYNMPDLKASTFIESKEVTEKGPLIWIYKFDLRKKGPIQGALTFKAHETERGSRIIEQGTVTVDFADKQYDFYNGDYDCVRL